MKKRYLIFWIILVLFVVLSFTGCLFSVNKNDLKQSRYLKEVGQSYLIENNLQNAYVEFQKAIELNPLDKELYYYLGFIQAKWRYYEKAIEYFEKAIRIDKHYAEAYNHLGIAYLSTEKWNKAIESFSKAIREPLYGTPEIAYYNMATTYYYKGDYLEALSAIEEALKRKSNFPQAKFLMGQIYNKLGKKSEAIKAFNNAIDDNPDYVDAHSELAKIYLKEGDRKKAFFHFEKVANSPVEGKAKEEALKYIEILK
jgi:tetratricopeptide (TPR) repeat protein